MLNRIPTALQRISQRCTSFIHPWEYSVRAARRVTRIETVNKRTGEVNDFTVHSAASAAHGLWFRGGGFTTMGYAAHNALADANLSVSAYKLFHKMCALQNRKDHGLVLVESQTKFAEQVGMSQASVSRGLKQLASQGFIYPDGRNWRIRPDFVFNGNGAAQGQAVQSIPADAPDPYDRKRADLKIVDGQDDSGQA
ncbi:MULTISPECIES: cyclic nucleotide-binding domain-containing protein [Streptomyces]|uniref:Uncharacterized protein n=1 Tax=Streptomyces lienomycini TaxID=284035 RepID=A0ABV9WZM2_9ACTN|nr:hypothetical protein [Streptomyces lienomycini]